MDVFNFRFKSSSKKNLKARAKKEPRERIKKEEKKIFWHRSRKEYFCDEEKGPVEFCSYGPETIFCIRR